MGFRKGLPTMRLMCDTYEAAGVYWWIISRPSADEKAARCIPLGYTAGVWGARTHDALGSLVPGKA
jgi:hypothetical protein